MVTANVASTFEVFAYDVNQALTLYILRPHDPYTSANGDIKDARYALRQCWSPAGTPGPGRRTATTCATDWTRPTSADDNGLGLRKLVRTPNLAHLRLITWQNLWSSGSMT